MLLLAKWVRFLRNLTTKKKSTERHSLVPEKGGHSFCLPLGGGQLLTYQDLCFAHKEEKEVEGFALQFGGNEKQSQTN